MSLLRSPVAEFIEASDTKCKISSTSIVPSTGSGTENLQPLNLSKYPVAELVYTPGCPEVFRNRSPVVPRHIGIEARWLSLSRSPVAEPVKKPGG